MIKSKQLEKIIPREKISDFSSGSLGSFINSSGAE